MRRSILLNLLLGFLIFVPIRTYTFADGYDNIYHLIEIAESAALNGRYQEAIDSLLLAGEQMQELEGGISQNYTDYIGFPIAIYLHSLNKINNACCWLSDIIRIRATNFQEDCSLATMYMYYSVLCRENGDYYDALLVAENGIKIAKSLEDCYRTLYGSLNGAAQACIKMNDYEAAIHYTKQIVECAKQDTNMLLMALNNLSSDYIEIEEYDKAIQVAHDGLKISDKYKSADQTALLFNLSLAYSYKGEYQSAIDFGLQSLNLKRQMNKPLDSFINSYINLGSDYEDLQMFDSASYYYAKASEMMLKKDSAILMENVPTYISIKLRQMELYKKLNQEQLLTKTIADFDEVISLWFPHYKERLLDTWRDMDNRRLQLIKETIAINCRYLIYQTKFANSKLAAQHGYDACLLYYGSALNLQTEKLKLIHEINNDTLYYLYATQIYLENELHFNRTAYSKTDLDSINRCILDCSYRVKQYLLAKDISLDLKIGWKDVQQSLKDDEIAIEFFRYATDSMDEYHAFVIRDSWDSPKSIVIKSNQTLKTSNDYRREIWQTIIDSAGIKKGEKIYFSPSGEMYFLPIETTFVSDSLNYLRYNDIYDIIRLSSTRVLCNRNNIIKKNTSACIYGGLTYIESTNQFIHKAKKTHLSYRQAFPATQDSLLLREIDRAQLSYLPYTKKEAEAIRDLLCKNKIKTTWFSHADGTEESFYALSGKSPSILHIATHGFYVSEDINNSPHQNLSEKADPMKSTGLLLSGSLTQHVDSLRSSNIQDGILSALEISYLDLRNTDLVILSCCNTGLGDITNDGVAGLQRGFKMAGVNSILMSLWAVDDAATYLLMTEFYKNYLGGKTKIESLREAQHYLRNYEQDGEKIFDDPKYWAAFILLDALD